jgi:hypothetical protein
VSIGEVNSKKFNRVTPGTNIPIIDEELIFSNPTEKKLILVLPWHFKTSILERYSEAIENGKVSFIFALPVFEVYSTVKS